MPQSPETRFLVTIIMDSGTTITGWFNTAHKNALKDAVGAAPGSGSVNVNRYEKQEGTHADDSSVTIAKSKIKVIDVK